MKQFYYNLTFACNSRCTFCAADSVTDNHHAKMQLDDVLRSFEQLDPGDVVVLNGGETTTYRSLLDVVRGASQCGARVTLFTNGRRLADRDLVLGLADAGLTWVTIPIYSTTAPLHNELTGTKRGFEETIAALQHLFALRTEHINPINIELKTLMMRPCVEGNPAVVDYIANTYGKPDRFVISGLIFSQQIRANPNVFIPTMAELVDAVKATYSRAKAHGFRTKMDFIPLCYLDEDVVHAYLSQQIRDEIRQERPDETPTTRYFDPMMPEGVERTRFYAPQCTDCPLKTYCHAGNEFALYPLSDVNEEELRHAN